MHVHESGTAPGGSNDQGGEKGLQKADTPDPPERAPTRRGRRVRRVLAVLAALVVVAGAPLLHRIADAVRGAPIEQLQMARALPAPTDPAFAELVAVLSDVSLTTSTRLEILSDATVYDRLFEDLASARSSITFFIYFCRPGRLGDRMTAALVDAARRGVEVRFLGDGLGCGAYVDELRAPLAEAGGRAEALRPIRWHTLHRAQHRNHARSVVIDGRVGYTGGFGLADTWLGHESAPPWREMSVRLTGPQVAQLQSAFLTAWAEATATLAANPALTMPERFDEAETPRPGSFEAVTTGLLVSRPGLGPTQAQRYLPPTLAGARRTLYITNAYFVPTGPMRALLLDAAARGVDVRVLLPGPDNDQPSTRWAGQLYFDELLSGGVRIWEYAPTMLHAKTLVVDGVWSTIGSLNLDPRSIRLNEEWSLVVHDAAVGATMDSLFLADLQRARELTLEAHRARPLLERLRELAVSLAVPVL
jgi:cardiolipin synthase